MFGNQMKNYSFMHPHYALKCFRVFSKNIQPGKLYCTIFYLKNLCGYFYWRGFSPFLVAKCLNFKNFITCSPRHYDILAKIRSRMMTDDVGSRARTTWF